MGTVAIGRTIGTNYPSPGSRRCLVPADGFYEWQAQAGGGSKQPYRIGLDDDAHFAFAGIREVDTFAILTTRPNPLAAKVHDRMPVVLVPEQWAAWLDPAGSQEAIEALTHPRPAEGMRALPVGTAVNRPDNEGSQVSEPTGPPLGEGPQPMTSGQPGLFD